MSFTVELSKPYDCKVTIRSRPSTILFIKERSEVSLVTSCACGKLVFPKYMDDGIPPFLRRLFSDKAKNLENKASLGKAAQGKAAERKASKGKASKGKYAKRKAAQDDRNGFTRDDEPEAEQDGSGTSDRASAEAKFKQTKSTREATSVCDDIDEADAAVDDNEKATSVHDDVGVPDAAVDDNAKATSVCDDIDEADATADDNAKATSVHDDDVGVPDATDDDNAKATSVHDDDVGVPDATDDDNAKATGVCDDIDKADAIADDNAKGDRAMDVTTPDWAVTAQ
nr:hypothetical protein [Tanacetum cinerariifolium]